MPIRTKIQSLSPFTELDLKPDKQRIYITLDIGGLRRDPRARPDFVFKPFLTAESDADVGVRQLSKLPRSWPEYESKIGFWLQKTFLPTLVVQQSIYQPVDRFEKPLSKTFRRHELYIPSFVYRAILKSVLKHPPTQDPYEQDWGAILSYDIDLDAAPPSEIIPNYEAGNFESIIKDYKVLEPIQLHVFDPPRAEKAPEERQFREGPSRRNFLEYPVASYTFQMTLSGRYYGKLVYPFKRVWSAINLFYGHWRLVRATRK